MSGLCLAICTHDRHDDLLSLLHAVIPQAEAAGAEMVVVDNGARSAEQIVRQFRTTRAIIYERLAEPGLVAARNAALALSMTQTPELIAFIDDDEMPDPGWLQQLASCLQQSGADICCGPLRPRFDVEPPAWAVAGGFYAKSGKAIGTGNMMFRSAILPADQSGWFQPAFAHIGGEDEELFTRLIDRGARFVTAEQAWVSERVPPERLKLGYIWRTGLRDGVIEVALLRQRNLSPTRAFLHVLRKTGLALAHVAQAWRGSWHLVSAMRDGAEVVGTVQGLLGQSATFYGRRA